MGPKPQVFKAPDGTEFSSRTEWRDYMMANYYSYKNKKNIKDVLIKKPGDIDGQVFDIAECENCTLVILDTCEQVQIDQVKNCKIFIGACTSSIFIRNCTDCIFYTCCRQLRLREVTSSSFYIYSMAEVHIEYSNTLQFAPFNGGYPEQAQHFQSAKLDPNHNLWYDIFDHNDPNKTHSNWSLMPENEYEEPWFPSTKCNPAVPRSKPGSVAKFEEKDEMQAFGVQQMISDAIQQGNEVVPPKLASPPKASPPKAGNANANKKLEQKKEEKVGSEISLEVSLLIASAIAKNIDVSTWFNEGGFKGKLPVLDFNTKLISLSLIVGMEEDWETKRELEVAVSSVSLKTIQHLCSSGVDKAKKPYIDVTKFITLCKTKLAEEMGEEFDDSDNINKVDDTIVGNIIVEDNDIDINIDDIPVPLGISSEEIVEKYANIGLNTNNQEDDDDAAPARPSTARGSRTATRFEFESTGRPKSAPTTSRSSTSNKRPVDATQLDVNNLTPTKKVFAESLTLPDSPFDEEVVFNVEDEDDVDTAVGGVISKSKARTLPKSSSLKPNTARSKPTVSAPTKSATKAPVQSKPVRTASAGPLRPTKHEHEPFVSARASRSMTRPATSSSISRPVSTQSSSFTRTSVSRPRPSSADPAQRYNRTSIGTSIASQPFHSTASIYSQKSISTEDQLVHFEKLVEDKVRQNVKQADSYHTIQVHLGFISDYTMVPHRGIAVTSSPRAWLSIKEIQAAFQAAYLRLPDAHMYALMRLVNKYAKTVRDTEPTGIAEDAVRTSVSNNPNSTVLSHSKISADWFKKYLVDLRLCKTPSSTRRSLSASIIRNNDNNDGIITILNIITSS
jgi:protein XRP2